MSPASAISMERHCHLPGTLRGQPRGAERVGSLSPNTAKPRAGSSLYQADQKETTRVGPVPPPQTEKGCTQDGKGSYRPQGLERVTAGHR